MKDVKLTVRRSAIIRLALTFSAFIIVFVFLFPIYHMISTSFKTHAEIFSTDPSFFPRAPTIDAYRVLFSRAQIPFFFYIRNSFVIACSTMIISTTLATLSAYGLARFRLKINRYVLFAYLFS